MQNGAEARDMLTTDNQVIFAQPYLVWEGARWRSWFEAMR
jgi:hypothetical protein